MRTVKVNICLFEELDRKVQDEVVDRYRKINVEDKMWAKGLHQELGDLGLEAVDLNPPISIDIAFKEDIETVANRIVKTRLGSSADQLYTGAKAFLSALEAVEILDPTWGTDILEDAFANIVDKYYLNKMISMYTFLTGDNEIMDTLIKEDYEFFEDGRDWQ